MLRQFSLLFLLSMSVVLANAEEDIRYYNVEVILFEHLDTGNQDAEDWKPSKQVSEASQAELSHILGQSYVMEAESVYQPELMFTLVPEQEYQLHEEATKIKESSSRRVLMHTAWRQPGLASEQAIRVYFKHIIENTDNSEQSTDKQHEAANSQITPATPLQPYIEGSIKVMLARYLHVDTDIMYFALRELGKNTTSTETDPAITLINEYRNDEEAFTLYQMKQLRRRMRSSELHYLDHPVIGMLLKITPYEKPEVVDKIIKLQ